MGAKDSRLLHVELSTAEEYSFSSRHGIGLQKGLRHAQSAKTWDQATAISATMIQCEMLRQLISSMPSN